MIGKFSNKCVVACPSIEALNLFNHDVQLNAYKIMENVLHRINSQEVTEFHLLADDSLTLEAKKYLSQNPSNIVVLYDSLPETMRKFWLDNFATNNRLDLIFAQNLQKVTTTKTLSLEGEILKVFNGAGINSDSSLDTLSNESKFKLIRSVYTLVTLGRPVTEDNMKTIKHSYNDALFLMGMTASQFKESIYAEIDSHYEEAMRHLLESSQKELKSMAYVEQSAPQPSEVRKGILGAIAMMKAKLNNSDLSSGSKFQFQMNEGAFSVDEGELSQEEIESSKRTMSLEEVFSSAENMYEAFVTGSKFEEFSALEKLSEKYAVEVLSSLSEPINLLINFYVQTTDQKYKTVAHQEGNKLILNVDLKTGETNLTLKGNSFKLNLFFPNNEEVKVNANEW